MVATGIFMTTAITLGTILNVSADFPKPKPGVAIVSYNLYTRTSTILIALFAILLTSIFTTKLFKTNSTGVKLMFNVVHILCGFGFGLGLFLSGMAMPSKAAAFLDLHNWDPSLAFVMFGAHIVHVPVMKLLIEPRMFDPPPIDPHEMGYAIRQINTTIVDKKLIGGAFLFGVGWALGCVCPGPAVLTLTASDSASSLILSVLWVFCFSLGGYFAKNKLCEPAPPFCRGAVCAPVACDDKMCVQVGCGQ
jgi:hypothetical protein